MTEGWHGDEEETSKHRALGNTVGDCDGSDLQLLIEM